MKRLTVYKRPILLLLVCAFFTVTSFGSQVNMGAKTTAESQTSTHASSVGAAYAAAAAVAAGVALYASAVVSAYELGTIIGHAMYDMFGGESYNSPSMHDSEYNSMDFSKFDV